MCHTYTARSRRTTAPKLLTYTTPQSLHRSPTPRHATPPLLFLLFESRGRFGGRGRGEHLRVSCASERYRCGAMRIFNVVCQPSAGIVRIESLSLCDTMRILNVVCQLSAGIVRVETLALWRLANFQRPRRTLCGDRACGKVLAVTPCEFSISPARRTLCGDRACRNALAEARCEF